MPHYSDHPKRMRYGEYLQSNHWRTLKAKKAQRTQPKCGLCRSQKNVDCHHLLYREWFNVTTTDLRWLCRSCHDLVHELLAAGEIKPSKKKRNNPQTLWVLTQLAKAAKKVGRGKER
jgi:hypothetical protein